MYNTERYRPTYDSKLGLPDLPDAGVSDRSGGACFPNPAARSSPPSCARASRRRSTRPPRNEEHFPSTIDPRIYHVKLIREHLGDLAGKRVLDVGCGKGRFARVFHEQQPEAELWGLDISEEMLRFVPAGIHTRAGSMTELPFETRVVRRRLRDRIAGARRRDRESGRARSAAS